MSSIMGNTKVQIIPEPAVVELQGNETYCLKRDTTISYSDKSLQFTANYLADYLDRYLGIPMQVVAQKKNDASQGDACIKLVNCKKKKEVGAYTLLVHAEGVEICGSDASGVFYGVQSLIQLLPTQAGIIPYLPLVRIADYPRFSYRGMHLDVVRHFFPISYIKQYIDYMAFHKLNYFHWHLNDDQGWRLKMDCFPELTDLGETREGEIEGVYPGVYKPLPYGGHYTREQVQEVVRYAAERFITVIPEIDIPGHCMAVLQAFPEFSTTPEEKKVCAQTWHVYEKQNNVLAPTPAVFDFLTKVYSELCDMFPGPYIHVGGDECAKSWWKASEQVQQFMREQGLKNEKALQSYFIHHVKKVLDAKGKVLMGWDEILEGGISKECIVMNWRRPEHGGHSIKCGNRTIFTSIFYTYFNLKESRSQREVGPDASPIPMEKVYNYKVVPEGLTAEEERLVFGVQGCLWTEYIQNPWKAEFSAFPRMAALAENAWTQPEKKDWTRFATHVLRQIERYELWGIRYSPFFLRKQKVFRKR